MNVYEFVKKVSAHLPYTVLYQVKPTNCLGSCTVIVTLMVSNRKILSSVNH